MFISCKGTGLDVCFFAAVAIEGGGLHSGAAEELGGDVCDPGIDRESGGVMGELVIQRQ